MQTIHKPSVRPERDKKIFRVFFISFSTQWIPPLEQHGSSSCGAPVTISHIAQTEIEKRNKNYKKEVVIRIGMLAIRRMKFFSAFRSGLTVCIIYYSISHFHFTDIGRTAYSITIKWPEAKFLVTMHFRHFAHGWSIFLRKYHNFAHWYRYQYSNVICIVNLLICGRRIFNK